MNPTRPILGIISAYTTLRKESNIEYGGPCPNCGGTDRLRVNTEKNGYFCRTCRGEIPGIALWKDGVDFLTKIMGKSLSDAEAEAGVPESDRYSTRSSFGNTINKSNLSKAPDDEIEIEVEEKTLPLKYGDRLGGNRINGVDDPDTPRAIVALKQRGIPDATIEHFGIKVARDDTFIYYPLVGQAGGESGRMKNMFYKKGAAKPKYLFSENMDNRPEDIVYYERGDLKQSIKANKGLLWLPAGEVDVWTLHAAQQHQNANQPINATFWLTGETTRPSNFLKFLEDYGVERICHAPDCDMEGQKLTNWLINILHGSGIALTILHLPGAEGSGYDLNDLWIDSDVDPSKFWDQVFQLPRDTFRNEKGHPSKGISGVMSDRIVRLHEDVQRIPEKFFSLPIPFKSISKYGGFAEEIPQRKLIAIIAPTSGGKSSFIECLIYKWMKMGYYGVLWSPEWSNEELGFRFVRHMTSLTQKRITQHRRYIAAEKDGEILDKSLKLTEQELQYLTDAQNQFSRYRGDILFVDNKLHYVEDVLDAMLNGVSYQRSIGQPVHYIVIDYLSMLETKDKINEGSRKEHVLNKIKRWLMDNDLIGVVGMQVTKTSSKGNKKHNDVLGIDDIYFARGQTVNLGVTLNFQWETVGTNRILKPFHLVHICKNSDGHTGILKMEFTGDYLRWDDMPERNVTTEAW